MNFNWDAWNFENKNQDSSKIAFSCSDTEFTWQQFHDKSVQLKNLLLDNLTKIQGPIIIYGHKESLFPIAMMACLLAEIPYVPVDVINPINRIKKISEICGSNTVINSSSAPLSQYFQNEVDTHFVFSTRQIDLNLSLVRLPKNLAYILFTSGSSGNPKGVMISREALISFNKNIVNKFVSSQAEVFINQALFSFDISLFELCLTLSTGGTGVLFSNTLTSNASEFISALKKQNCSFWNSTPSFLQLCLMNKEFNAENIPSLDKFMLMGETIPSNLFSKLKAAFPKCTLYNGYGPTEATVIVAFYQVAENDSGEKTPISNFPSSQLSLTDLASTEKNPSEIIISGNQVGEGYLNAGDESDAAFTTHQNKKTFRTGDLGYIENNKLFFHSRKDDQIKYHGYRIEPAEIDHVLTQFSFIEYCITIPLFKNNQTLRLITFIPKSHNPLISNTESFANFHDILAIELPTYMTKPEFILVDKLPYNSSFKVDKNQLLADYLAG